ncbi:MAG: response regulator, partial [Oleibacter sp.]|nr:response regulator [Thalassolituus sp.]
MTTPSSANDQIRALIVDDEADIRRLTVKAIERSGFDCHAVAGIKEALSALQETAYNFCITDMRLPDGDGLSLIRHVNQHYPDMPIAMITAYGNLEVGVDALKSGAFDVLAKPLELSSLRNLAEAAKKLLKKRSPLPTYCHSLLFGDSAIMETFRATLYRLARTQAPVNITAPEGCDRRGIARALHYLSTRASQPFISVNCASLHNQENYDSEGAVLFGDVLPNDSSISSEQGIFQIANKGSVFLENIDQLSEFGQMRLIELLEERQLRNLQDGT